MATVGYARVSSVGQKLAVQLEQLASNGAEKIFQEKISGAKRERPELNLMLDWVRDGDTVVVTKLDRLARSVKDLLEIVALIESKGAFLKILNMNLDTSTPTGRLMLSVMGAVAEFEREMIRERQREGIDKAQLPGSGVQFGRPSVKPAKVAEVLRLASLAKTDRNITRASIARDTGVSLSSVRRLLIANDAQF